MHTHTHTDTDTHMRARAHAHALGAAGIDQRSNKQLPFTHIGKNHSS